MATYNVIQKHKSTIKHNDTQWHTMTHEKSVHNVWHKVDKRQWVCVKHLRPNTELTTEKSKEKTWHRTMNGSLRTSHGMTWRDVTWRDVTQCHEKMMTSCLSSSNVYRSSRDKRARLNQVSMWLELTDVVKRYEEYYRLLFPTWHESLTSMFLRLYGQLFLEQCNSTWPNHPSISNDKR